MGRRRGELQERWAVGLAALVVNLGEKGGCQAMLGANLVWLVAYGARTVVCRAVQAANQEDLVGWQETMVASQATKADFPAAVEANRGAMAESPELEAVNPAAQEVILSADQGPLRELQESYWEWWEIQGSAQS